MMIQVEVQSKNGGSRALDNVAGFEERSQREAELRERVGTGSGEQVRSAGKDGPEFRAAIF
jgi:hypothetical protein